MALGAQRKNILWSFVGQGVRWTAIGGCIGVAAALTLAALTLVRFTRRILFEIIGYDPKVLLAVAAIISAATFEYHEPSVAAGNRGDWLWLACMARSTPGRTVIES
jgi:hypothetical protein